MRTRSYTFKACNSKQQWGHNNQRIHEKSINSDVSPACMVMVGDDQELISLPRNSVITIPSKTTKVKIKKSYLLELAANNILPTGIVVYGCYILLKTKKAMVTLVSTTDSNIWIM